MKKNERAASIPDKRNLPGMLYRPIDQRKDGNGGSNGVLLRGKCRIGDSYEMTDLPASDYQRMFET